MNANGQFLGSPSELRGLVGPLLAVSGANLSSNSSMAYLPLQLLLAGCSNMTLAQCHTVGAAPGGTLPATPSTPSPITSALPCRAPGERR